MQIQREENFTKQSTSPDLIISFVVFAACCILSFMAEPSVLETIFGVTP